MDFIVVVVPDLQLLPPAIFHDHHLLSCNGLRILRIRIKLNEADTLLPESYENKISLVLRSNFLWK